jgi:transcriptional regulator with XRE-family HTH domain
VPSLREEESGELSTLGQEIAAARKARELTQKQLAEAAGLSRQTVAALEAGTVVDLGIRKILRVLEHLNLSLVVRPAGHPVTLDDLLQDQQQDAKRRRR